MQNHSKTIACYAREDRFIEIHNKIRYLVLFDEWCDKILDRMKYLVSKKNRIADIISHDYGKFRINSYNSLPIKILTFHIVIIPIKSVFNEN